MRVLVLGGAGYLGAHMVRLLQRHGDEPIVFDNVSVRPAPALGGCPVVDGDLLDTMALMHCLEQHRPELVMHLAMRGDGPTSLRAPQDSYRHNLAGTMNLLGAMHQHGLRRLIFSSSAAVYGAPGAEPVAESAPTRPLTPFARSLLYVEGMIADYATAHGLRALCLRGFSAAGADPASGLGPPLSDPPRLIPAILQAALEPDRELQLFGGELATADGYPLRDFIHVSDLCEAHRLAGQRLDTLPPGTTEVLNLGSGTGHSTLQVLRRAEQLLDREIPWQAAAPRPGDAPGLVADARRAREWLDWECRRSDLDNILVTTWAWLENRRAKSAT